LRNQAANNGPDTENPIGIFDSGIGGLTVVKEIQKLLPGENIYYLGDTARVPYGIRSEETVNRYALENTEFLLKKNIKLLVVACNTVSSISIDILKQKTEVPVVDVLGPGAIAAIKKTSNRRIGIIGTEATIRSNAYQRSIRRIDSGISVSAIPCPLFVPLVEEGWTEGKVVNMIVTEYLRTLKEKGIDTLVLGCTHYPLLKRAIREVMGEINLVDSAIETAQTVKDILNSQGRLNKGNHPPEHRFFVTDGPERFQRIGERFLGQRIENIEKVKLSYTI
jgi:glutamate racemase